MNDRQNTVVATTVVSLLLVLVYLCPWRAQTSGEIQWSPIYQPPISYTRTYDPEYGTQGGSRMESDEAQIAYGILGLELLAVGAAGAALYVVTASSTENESRENAGE
jgi:hypothetical protein